MDNVSDRTEGMPASFLKFFVLYPGLPLAEMAQSEHGGPQA